MVVQDMEEKTKLMLTHLSLSSTTECFMGGKHKGVESLIPLQSNFLRSIFIMQNIGFSLSWVMRSLCCSLCILWFNILSFPVRYICHSYSSTHQNRLLSWGANLMVLILGLPIPPECSIANTGLMPTFFPQASEHIATAYAELRSASSTAKISLHLGISYGCCKLNSFNLLIDPCSF